MRALHHHFCISLGKGKGGSLEKTFMDRLTSAYLRVVNDEHVESIVARYLERRRKRLVKFVLIVTSSFVVGVGFGLMH